MIRLSFRTKLLLAFAVDLALMVTLGVFAASQMGLMNQRATFVERHTIPSLDILGRVDGAVNRYRVLQLEYLIFTNLADKDRIELKMGEVEAQMDSILAEYGPLVNSDAEAQRFANLADSWTAIIFRNRESFIPMARLENTGSVQPFYSRMNPLYDQLAVAMDQLAAESRAQAAAALTDVGTTYQMARTFILGDTLLALLISAGIGLIFSARIARRIGIISTAARSVARGDLSPRVVVSGNDELTSLADNFNQMVVSLREQHRVLEQRNDELAESLARQEVLTADLIRRQDAEAAALQAQAAAEAANQAKSQFLATMSHELRTPLNAILGYAQVMRLGAAQQGLSDATVEQLDRILSAGKHLTGMINNVLDFSRIEQGHSELDLSLFDPARVIGESLDVVLPLALKRGNCLENLTPPFLGTFLSDAGKIRQILINIVGNAAKFTEDGLIRVHADREDDAGVGDAAGRWLVIRVEDSGIGIAAEDLPRLFQPFSQVDPSVTRRYEGSGLGLVLSRRLAQALGGAIEVESILGKGSTFTIRLPVQSSVEPDGMAAAYSGQPSETVATER